METTKSYEVKEDEEKISLLPKEEKELGFLLLGVILGAVLGILGNLWVAFLFELVRNLIAPELWTSVSFLGLVIPTILSIYALIKAVKTAQKYIMGEESLVRLAERTTKKIG